MAPIVLVPCLLVLSPVAVVGQSGWTVEGEVGASVFFGNTEQVTVTTRVKTEVADSAREFSADAAFHYGEATDESGHAFVNKRAWTAGLAFDYRPFDRWSPFVLGRVESSFESRIDHRFNLGAGAKYTFVRSEISRLDLSAALLAERTLPLPSDSPTEVADDDLLARWSLRFRASRALSDERLTLSTESFYRPNFVDAGDFTMASTSSVAFEVTEVVSLKLSFVDTYDSQARGRGARTNNDGQLFFSVLSTF